MKRIYIFTERNQWECETWNFFVRMTEEQESAIRDLISDDSSYRLVKSDMTEEEVKERVSRSQCRGYMPSWNDVGEMLTPPPKVGDHPADQLYKGNIREFCAQAHNGEESTNVG